MHAESLDIKLLPTIADVAHEIILRNNEKHGIFLIGSKKSLSLEQVLEGARMQGVIE